MRSERLCAHRGGCCVLYPAHSAMTAEAELSTLVNFISRTDGFRKPGPLKYSIYVVGSVRPSVRCRSVGLSLLKGKCVAATSVRPLRLPACLPVLVVVLIFLFKWRSIYSPSSHCRITQGHTNNSLACGGRRGG